MKKRASAEQFRRRFGTVPDVNYFPEDMVHIRTYFDFRRDTGRDEFLLDEITWNDLEGDDVFRRIIINMLLQNKLDGMRKHFSDKDIRTEVLENKMCIRDRHYR